MNIFISYRRSDSRHVAARIAEYLTQTPRIRSVFFDVDSIDAGVDFPTRINEALSQANVCIVVIGEQWSAVSDGSGAPRILQRDDLVRQEISKAFELEKKVVPVLVDGATMPGASELPQNIQVLSRLNAVLIRHLSFKQDMAALEDAVFGREPITRTNRFFKRHPVFVALLKGCGGLIASAILIVTGAVIHNLVTGNHLYDVFGSVALVQLLVVAVLLAGFVGPIWGSRGERNTE